MWAAPSSADSPGQEEIAVGLWHNLKVRLGLEDDWDDEYYEDDAGYADEQAEDEAYAPAPAPSRRELSGRDSDYGRGLGSICALLGLR